jgi:hypothetical protein
VHLDVHIELHAGGSPNRGPTRSPKPHHSTGLKLLVHRRVESGDHA